MNMISFFGLFKAGLFCLWPFLSFLHLWAFIVRILIISWVLNRTILPGIFNIEFLTVHKLLHKHFLGIILALFQLFLHPRTPRFQPCRPILRGEVSGEEYVLDILADEDLLVAPVDEVTEESGEVFREKSRAGYVSRWAKAEKNIIEGQLSNVRIVLWVCTSVWYYLVIINLAQSFKCNELPGSLCNLLKPARGVCKRSLAVVMHL